MRCGWPGVAVIVAIDLLPIAFLALTWHCQVGDWQEAVEDAVFRRLAGSAAVVNASVPFWARSRRQLLSALGKPESLSRAPALDVLLGAPGEFSDALAVNEALIEPFSSLRASALALVAVESGHSGSGGGSRTMSRAFFQQAVLRVVATRKSWPPTLRRRLRDAMFSNAEEQGERALSGVPLPLEVDAEATSPPLAAAYRGTWLRTGILAASAWVTGHRRVEMPAASIVVAEGAAADDEYMLLRWNSSSLALQCAQGGGAVFRHLVIEQPHRLVDDDATLAPRYFTVHGETMLKEAEVEHGLASHFSIFLGAFEYALAAPARQTFHLSTPWAAPAPRLRGIRIEFESPGWGAKYLRLHRVRAFGELVVPS